MRLLVYGIAAAGLALLLDPARAAVPEGYVTIAQAEQVPADILYAIACAEAGRQMPDGSLRPWPWSLNVAGESRYFDTRAAAHAALLDVLAESPNVDIGLGQINWYWHRDRFRGPWQALDPYENLRAAARFLRELFDRCQCDDWWIAVEHYHAPSDTSGAEQRRARYRKAVEQCWNDHAV
jgi:hypothetical protein